MKTKIKRTNISSIAPFFLFVFFAICVVTTLLIGAKLYRNQTERDRIGYSNRTVSQYLTTRIRQSDRYDSFFIGDFYTKEPSESGNTFFFCEVIGGAEYYTCIYCHDGYLYELFSAATDTMDLTSGEKILEVKSISFTDNKSTVTVDITHADGSTQSLILYVRSERGE